MPAKSPIAKAVKKLFKIETPEKCPLCEHKLKKVMDSEATLLPCGHKVHFECFRDMYLNADKSKPVCCDECPSSDDKRVVQRIRTKATGGGNELEFDVSELEKRQVWRPAQ
jgi:hypothetical protein